MRSQYNGIYAKDTLPDLMNSGGYIANTDVSTDIGEHWVLAFKQESKLFFIDSFAEPPRYYGKEFDQWIGKNAMATEICQLGKPLQHPQSHMCGLYVLYFFYFLARQFPMEKILKFFSNNFLTNDRRLLNFAKRKFGNIRLLSNKGGSHTQKKSGIFKEELNRDFSVFLSQRKTWSIK